MITNKQTINCEAAVIGGGPAGQMAALELANLLGSVVLIGPRNSGQETRTTALMMPSIAWLKRYNIWQKLETVAAPLQTMRILDGTKRLIRSPAVEFRASELQLSAFGYNLPNRALNAALAEAVSNCSNIIRLEGTAQHYDLKAEYAEIELDNRQTVQTKLIAAADGRNSKARQAAGITVSCWSYPQTALTLSFRHEFPHNFISTEFHTEEGPFTQVPLIGNRSALVWTMRPEKAQHFLGLGNNALSKTISERMGFILGQVEVENSPESWPMGGMAVKNFAAKRVAVLGEAAHVFPPIGAQGLNLTIRDVERLGQAVKHNQADSGAEVVMRTYNKYRRLDVSLRTGFIHGLNRALLSNFLPIQLIRSGGLELLRKHSLLRNLFMHEGIAPGTGFKKILPPLSRLFR